TALRLPNGTARGDEPNSERYGRRVDAKVRRWRGPERTGFPQADRSFCRQNLGSNRAASLWLYTLHRSPDNVRIACHQSNGLVQTLQVNASFSTTFPNFLQQLTRRAVD